MVSFVAFMDPTLLIQQVGRELSRAQGKRDKRFFSLQILGWLKAKLHFIERKRMQCRHRPLK